MSELRQRQSIRNQLIQRAEQYIQSTQEYPGEIVSTAFVLDGLLEFGLPPQDHYIQHKLLWLQSQCSDEGKVCNAQGRVLTLETGWLARVFARCRLESALTSSNAAYRSNVQNDLSADLSADLSDNRPDYQASDFVEPEFLVVCPAAVQFLNHQFSQPTLAERRGRLLGEYFLSCDRYYLLDSWDLYAWILYQAPDCPSDGPFEKRNVPGWLLCGASSVSSSPTSKSTENVQSVQPDRDRLLSLPCRQDRREGYFVFAQTVVLLI